MNLNYIMQYYRWKKEILICIKHSPWIALQITGVSKQGGPSLVFVCICMYVPTQRDLVKHNSLKMQGFVSLDISHFIKSYIVNMAINMTKIYQYTIALNIVFLGIKCSGCRLWISAYIRSSLFNLYLLGSNMVKMGHNTLVKELFLNVVVR